MPSVTYVDPDGTSTEVEVPAHDSVMEGAIVEGIEGIVAECGGNAMCATCHVYVREEFLKLLEPMGEIEDAMLDLAASERRPNSRLSCQISMKPELNGLTVDLPESQQ